MDALIVGAGRVGRTAGLVLALRGFNVFYMDVVEEVARAAAEDTAHAAACAGSGARVGWTREPLDVDVVVVAASAQHGILDTRMRLLEQNAGIIAGVAERVYPYAPGAWYIIVSNPVDVLATIFARLTGSTRVLSTGTFIDSARLRVWLSRRLGVPLSRVEGLVGGIHGEDLVVFWSTVRVDGRPVRLGGEDERMLVHYLVEEPWEIVKAIGMTSAGAGTMAAVLAETLASGTPRLVAAAPYHGGVCVGVPVLLGSWSAVVREDVLEEAERAALEEKRRKVAEAAERALEALRAGS